MADERWERIQKIFEEALRLKPEDREQYLDEACGDDVDMRREVESILINHFQVTTEFLKPPERPLETIPEPRPDPLIGKLIGNFHIKSLIGSGGMGKVYLALEEKPRRNVAFKTMKADIPSKSALRRFEYESQTLARLRHPGIAQVYRVGVHDDGESHIPYFAMEYIPNAQTIIEYADTKQLGIRDRLRLFAKVCDAAHHGHQKGIIHRDLTPRNILIDPSGQPKIFDFGLARATDSDLAEPAQQTEHGQLIGTRQYMAPEQFNLDARDLDARTDVYALGCVLYELVCGSPPHDLDGLCDHEIIHILRTRFPVRPGRINRALRGDPETIILKALEKDRERRYRSAADLADNLRAYLDGEPIPVRPPSVPYLLRIAAKRHRRSVIVGSLIAAVVILAASATVVAIVRSQAAVDLLDRVGDLRAEAARRSTPACPTGDEMLPEVDHIITDMSSSKPFLTIRREANIRALAGQIYYYFGALARAEEQLTLALNLQEAEFGSSHEETLVSKYYLGRVYRSSSRFSEGRQLLMDAWDGLKRVLGTGHPRTLEAMSAVGMVYRAEGRYEDAESLLKQTLNLQESSEEVDQLDIANTMHDLACLHIARGAYKTAETICIDALDIQIPRLGEEHPLVIVSMDTLAESLARQARYQDAENKERTALEYCRKILGTHHLYTIRCMNNLGVICVYAKKYNEAAEVFAEALRNETECLEYPHLETAKTLDFLAYVRCKEQSFTEAEALYKRSLDAFVALLGPTHEQTLLTKSNLGNCYLQKGQPEAAKAHLEDAVVEAAESEAGVAADYYGAFLERYATCMNDLGQRNSATETLAGVYELWIDKWGPEDHRARQLARTIAELDELEGCFKEAGEWRSKAAVSAVEETEAVGAAEMDE